MAASSLPFSPAQDQALALALLQPYYPRFPSGMTLSLLYAPYIVLAMMRQRKPFSSISIENIVHIKGSAGERILLLRPTGCPFYFISVITPARAAPLQQSVLQKDQAQPYPVLPPLHGSAARFPKDAPIHARCRLACLPLL